MDILNFISWIKAGKYSPTMPADALTVVGVPNPTRGDAYLPVTVPVTAIGALFPIPTSNTNIGKQIGGGIVVAEWDDNGVKKALVESSSDVTGYLIWTVTAQQGLTCPGATSYSNGSTNTDAIIAQAGILNNTYAAGAARLHTGGGFNDWYLPSIWELNMCYDAAAIVNNILSPGNGFNTAGAAGYWSSLQASLAGQAIGKDFTNGSIGGGAKSSTGVFRVRAVRIHIL